MSSGCQSPEGKKEGRTAGQLLLLSSSGEQQGYLGQAGLNVLDLFAGIRGLGNESTRRAGKLGWSQTEAGVLSEVSTGNLSKRDSPPRRALGSEGDEVPWILVSEL